MGYKDVQILDQKQLQTILPPSYAKEYGYLHFLPLVVVFVLMTIQSFPTKHVPDIGIPAIFLLGSFVGLFCGRPFNFFKVTLDGIQEAMPILCILAGVGMFIQIMTLTGGRGWTIVSFLSLPPVFLYLGISVSMPLFGAVSAYGSASILGVPFILALISKNTIFTSAALSAIAGLGDLMPPTALAGIFAAQVVEEKNYFKVLCFCIFPAFFLLVMGLGVLFLAPLLDKIL